MRKTFDQSIIQAVPLLIPPKKTIILERKEAFRIYKKLVEELLSLCQTVPNLEYLNQLIKFIDDFMITKPSGISRVIYEKVIVHEVNTE